MRRKSRPKPDSQCLVLGRVSGLLRGSHSARIDSHQRDGQACSCSRPASKSIAEQMIAATCETLSPIGEKSRLPCRSINRQVRAAVRCCEPYPSPCSLPRTAHPSSCSTSWPPVGLQSVAVSRCHGLAALRADVRLADLGLLSALPCELLSESLESCWSSLQRAQKASSECVSPRVAAATVDLAGRLRVAGSSYSQVCPVASFELEEWWQVACKAWLWSSEGLRHPSKASGPVCNRKISLLILIRLRVNREESGDEDTHSNDGCLWLWWRRETRPVADADQLPQTESDAGQSIGMQACLVASDR